MDHVTLLSKLTPDQRTALHTRSDARGVKHLAGYLAVLGMMTVAIVNFVPGWWFLLLPQGIMLCFLFTLSHEATHRTPFAAPWLNDVIGHLIAPIILLPFLWFRYFHLAHHKYTNDPERDPEIAGHPRPNSWRSLALYVSGVPYWISMARVLLQNAQGRCYATYIPAAKRPAIIREARLCLIALLCAFASFLFTPVLLWVWVLPVLLGQPVLRIYLLAEHGLCPPVANMLENTRTTFTNRVIRWLAWNMPYHIEHHSAPNVPFHRLPELHQFMCTHLVSTSDGYVSFSKTYVRNINVID